MQNTDLSPDEKKVSDSWQLALTVDQMDKPFPRMKRIAGKQIALFKTHEGFKATDNRCPHEGYPLSEGSVDGECVLTCNWHNWKFNLNNGENLYGGDQLRTYPVQMRGDALWIDLSDPPYSEQYEKVTKNLHSAFEDHEYDRIAREIARLIKIGADPLDSLRLAIQWSWQHLEFGWTHAYAGMADWLQIYFESDDDEEVRLICLVESVAHTADDILREPEFPYSIEVQQFNEEQFIQAVEEEDETTAIALIKGGIRDGLTFTDFEHALATVALAHYNDFGHSLIYVSKVKYLIEYLGQEVSAPLLISLVRSIIFAPREDKIPEFRDYQPSLKQWSHPDNSQLDAQALTPPQAKQFIEKGIKTALQKTVACSGQPAEIIYQELLMANALNLLAFDLEVQNKIKINVADNANWLNLTHGITFANAVRKLCTKYPELWPQGLLQLACFCGRNAEFTTREFNTSQWQLGADQLPDLLEKIINHEYDEYIVSIHCLKTFVAMREELEILDSSRQNILLAAVNRYINSPIRRRQPRRTAYQSMKFVAME